MATGDSADLSYDELDIATDFRDCMTKRRLRLHNRLAGKNRGSCDTRVPRLRWKRTMDAKTDPVKGEREEVF
jgi:hypothetical protein